LKKSLGLNRSRSLAVLLTAGGVSVVVSSLLKKSNSSNPKVWGLTESFHELHKKLKASRAGIGFGSDQSMFNVLSSPNGRDSHALSNHKRFLERLKSTKDINPNIAWSILVSAPSFNSFKLLVEETELSLTSMWSTRPRLPGLILAREEIKSFAELLRNKPVSGENSDVYFLFILAHISELIASPAVGEIKEFVYRAAAIGVDTFKPAFMEVIKSLFTELEPRRIIPSMIQLINEENFHESTYAVSQLIRLSPSGSLVGIKPDLLDQLYSRFRKSPAHRARILELFEEFLRLANEADLLSGPTSGVLLSDFFIASSDERARIIRILSSRTEVESALALTVSGLEKELGVSDFEISERKKVIDQQLSRPLVDSELFSFHDDNEMESVEIVQDNHSLFIRLAILSDIIRHKISNGELPAQGGDLLSCARLLLGLAFNHLAREYESTVDPKLLRQLFRAIANISTLGRYIDVDSRDQFIANAREFIQKADTGAMKVHERAEFDRLRHNVRCLPIKSAPLLIDSLLPLSSSTPADSEVDFVFIHGLRGGLKTWRVITSQTKTDKDKDIRLWPPACLKEQFPSFRLLAHTYEAPLWYATHKQHYLEIDVKKNFEEMALSLRSALADAGVGRNGKKVVFITFSMGGLVAKRALVDDPHLRSNTIGIVFFATPHLGSPIADYAYYTPGLGGSLVSPFVADLSRKSKQVINLHEAYIATCQDIPTMSVCETAQADIGAGIKAMIVPYESCAACQNDGKALLAGDNVDHESVSKVNANQMCADPRISALLEFLKSVTAGLS
jgi:hypothetical protein